MQDRLVAIGEGDVLEPDRAFRLAQSDGGHRLAHGRGLLQDARELLERRARRLEHVVELRKVLQRVEELPQVQDEGGQHAKRQLALGEEVAAIQQDAGRGQAPEQVDGRPERRHKPVGPDVGVAVPAVDVFEDLLVARLAAERLHGADSTERFDVMHDDQHDRAAHGAIGARRVDAEPVGQPEDDGHRDQRHEAEAQVEVKKDRADRHHRDQGRDHGSQARRQKLVQGVDVRRQTGDDPPRRVPLIKREGQRLDVRVERSPQLEEDVGSEPS